MENADTFIYFFFFFPSRDHSKEEHADTVYNTHTYARMRIIYCVYACIRMKIHHVYGSKARRCAMSTSNDTAKSSIRCLVKVQLTLTMRILFFIRKRVHNNMCTRFTVYYTLGCYVFIVYCEIPPRRPFNVIRILCAFSIEVP